MCVSRLGLHLCVNIVCCKVCGFILDDVFVCVWVGNLFRWAVHAPGSIVCDDILYFKLL